MSHLFFPDNTVLVNFALINRMDLLEKVLNGNGRWCAAVADECAKSALQPDLGALRISGEILGAPWYPEPAEHVDVRALRLELARPGDSRLAHLGEAETLAIMLRRCIRGWFVTDDKEAARLAARHQIKVVSTWDLLRIAGRCGFVDRETLWGYVQTLRAHSRGGLGDVVARASFDRWLGELPSGS